MFLSIGPAIDWAMLGQSGNESINERSPPDPGVADGVDAKWGCPEGERCPETFQSYFKTNSCGKSEM